jgi:hypothetical protein
MTNKRKLRVKNALLKESFVALGYSFFSVNKEAQHLARVTCLIPK